MLKQVLKLTIDLLLSKSNMIIASEGGAYFHPDVEIDVFDQMGLGLKAAKVPVLFDNIKLSKDIFCQTNKPL
jgi:hypothetical protein